MRIICKYKDFYDPFGYITGELDESIVYVRKKEVYDEEDKDKKNIIKYIKEHYYVNESTVCYNYDTYEAGIDTVVVGIYPYVYVCPFYVIEHQDGRLRSTAFLKNIDPISISEERIFDEDYEKIYSKVQTKFNEYTKTVKTNGEKLHITKIPNYFWQGHEFDITTQSWKQEDRELFKNLGVPVFIYTDTKSEIAPYMQDSGLVLNPVINQEHFNILGSNRNEVMSDMNIYNNIEDFLWEIKQAPEPNPDNKTKIINAGFDLKTSFRKM